MVCYYRFAQGGVQAYDIQVVTKTDGSVGYILMLILILDKSRKLQWFFDSDCFVLMISHISICFYPGSPSRLREFMTKTSLVAGYTPKEVDSLGIQETIECPDGDPDYGIPNGLCTAMCLLFVVLVWRFQAFRDPSLLMQACSLWFRGLCAQGDDIQSCVFG